MYTLEKLPFQNFLHIFSITHEWRLQFTLKADSGFVLQLKKKKKNRNHSTGPYTGAYMCMCFYNSCAWMWCCVTELHAHDFVIKDFIIKRGIICTRPLHIYETIHQLLLFVGTVRSSLTWMPMSYTQHFTVSFLNKYNVYFFRDFLYKSSFKYLWIVTLCQLRVLIKSHTFLQVS